MKRFVRNDNGLYNMTKRQSTFLYIMTGYRKVTRILQKGYKNYKTVTLLFSPVLPEGVNVIYTGLAGICTYKGAAKGAAFRSCV